MIVGFNNKKYSQQIDRYRVLALQSRTDAVNQLSPSEARSSMLATIKRIHGNIKAANAFLGGDLKLVVLPEYFLTGYPMGDSVDSWREKAAIAPDGVEYENLSAVASENKIYLSGNAYESDPNFPNIYFQTSFLIDSSGDLILRYRRLHSLFSPSPWDFWDRYVDLYGIEAVFPVARTEIGNIAMIAS